MRNRIVDLRTVPARELRRHPRNWRDHPAGQREALAETIERIGMTAALIARETADGSLELIDGHLRHELADDAEVPVLVVDLDADEATEMLASFDPLGAMADVNREALAELLRPMDPNALAVDLGAIYGLDGLAVGRTNGQSGATAGDGGAEPAAAGEPPAEPIAARGDVWALGPHRVMCGDATSPNDTRALLDGADVDAILTDPPYSSGSFQESGKSRGSKGTTADYKSIIGDNLSSRGYQALLRHALDLVPVDVIYVFTDWKMWVYLFDLAEASGYLVRGMIVWNKLTPGMGMGWRSQHELILCGTRSAGLWSGHQSVTIGNVIDCPRQPNELHATQKPVEVLSRLVAATPFARTIYDPFAGSGSTLFAADLHDRTAYLMELDPAYVDVIARRWHETSGVEPVRLANHRVDPPAPAA